VSKLSFYQIESEDYDKLSFRVHHFLSTISIILILVGLLIVISNAVIVILILIVVFTNLSPSIPTLSINFRNCDYLLLVLVFEN